MSDYVLDQKTRQRLEDLQDIVEQDAKLILNLRMENAKLRAATLEDAANVADTKAITVGNGRDEYSLACRHIAQELRAAAAAIRETGDE